MIASGWPGGICNHPQLNGTRQIQRLERHLRRHLGFEAALWLPGQRVYSTQIPVCLWFLSKNELAGPTFAPLAITGDVNR